MKKKRPWLRFPEIGVIIVAIEINLQPMKKFILGIAAVLLLATACQKVELKREIPTSPKESYEPLPQ